jgi:hypothetical protein
VVTQACPGPQRPDQQRDLFALDGPAAAVGFDAALAVDLCSGSLRCSVPVASS